MCRGEILGVIGRSGAGKSTLIRCINGLETPDQGEIWFDGAPVTAKLAGKIGGLRSMQRRIGMIFQHFNLLSSRKIIDNVALPLKLEHASKARRHARAMEMLELVGLADKANQYPAQLSGGQKQRVGIARALTPDPDLLLSDEATSALDPETTRSILELLGRINKQMSMTIMLVTHEMDVIRALAERVIVLDQGRIVEEGTIRDVMARPKNITTKSLLANLLPQLPPHIAIKLSSQPCPGCPSEMLIELRLSGTRASAPFLHHLSCQTGLIARLVQGGVEHVQGEAVGHFFLAVPVAGTDTDDRQIRLKQWLETNTDAYEVSGFVPV